MAEGDKVLGPGKELDDIYRYLDIADSTWHRWLTQYGGMKAKDAKRFMEPKVEYARMKNMIANQALDTDMLREISSRNFQPRTASAETRRICLPDTRYPNDGPAPW